MRLLLLVCYSQSISGMDHCRKDLTESFFVTKNVLSCIGCIGGEAYEIPVGIREGSYSNGFLAPRERELRWLVMGFGESCY